MNITRTIAIAKKEFIHIFRDPRSLGMAIAIPMLLLVLFGYALTLDVDNVPMAVWDQDKTQTSQDFIRKFDASRYFNIIAYADDYRSLQAYIDENKALMAMVLPYNFSKDLKAGRNASVQLLVDGSDSNTATIAMSYVSAVVARYNNSIILDTLSMSGMKYNIPIDLRLRVWFNADLKSRNYIIPGLIAVIMMVIAALLTSLTVAKEWETGTMEQLISTPVKSNELIFGKLIPYFIIGMLDVVIAVAMGQFLFHVPLRGNIFLLFIMSALFLTGALSLGLLISIVTKNQLIASQLAMITTFLPAFLLSGFMYAISNMPRPIQVLTHIIPARYFVEILKGVYLKGIGIRLLWPQALALLIFSFVALTLANKRFKKRVE